MALNEAPVVGKDCKLYLNTGTYALEVNGAGTRVEGNEIYDAGGGGILTRNLHAEHQSVASPGLIGMPAQAVDQPRRYSRQNIHERQHRRPHHGDRCQRDHRVRPVADNGGEDGQQLGRERAGACGHDDPHFRPFRRAAWHRQTLLQSVLCRKC